MLGLAFRGHFAKQQYEHMSHGERDKVYDSLLPEQQTGCAGRLLGVCTDDLVGSWHIVMDTMPQA
jgi:hypothetical protein